MCVFESMFSSYKLPLFLSLVVFFAFLYILFFLISVILVRCRMSQLSELETSADRIARAGKILDKADNALISAQIIRFIACLCMGILLYGVSSSIVADWSQSNDWVNSNLVFVTSSLFIFILLVFTGSLTIILQVAKALVVANPERYLTFLSPVCSLAAILCVPLRAVVELISRRLFELFRITPSVERGMAISADEISEIVELSGEAGELEEDEIEMLQGVFGFSDTLVREVMTPRADIAAISINTQLGDAVRTFIEEGFSRLLVYGDDLDDVQGVILAKDLMPLLLEAEQNFNLKALLRPPHLAAAEQPIDDLLQQFRAEANHFAVVLDEHGGVQGIVTMEDLIEEIVGEIFDEFDDPEQEVTETRTGELLIDGGMALDDLNDEYDFNFPEGEYDTVAGFVIHMLGRIPKRGEVLYFEGVKIQVERTAQNRITLLKLSGFKH